MLLLIPSSPQACITMTMQCVVAMVAGAVCEDKLYLVCTWMQDDMRIFDVCKKEWTALKLTVTPLLCSALSSTHMGVACFSLEVGSFALLASYLHAQDSRWKICKYIWSIVPISAIMLT